MVDYELRKFVSDNLTLLKNTALEFPELEDALQPIIHEESKVSELIETSFSNQVRGLFI